MRLATTGIPDGFSLAVSSHVWSLKCVQGLLMKVLIDGKRHWRIAESTISCTNRVPDLGRRLSKQFEALQLRTTILRQRIHYLDDANNDPFKVSLL